MALPRPLVSVYNPSGLKDSKGCVVMPTVMQTPIRADLVSFVHDNILRNSRQAYGVKENSGYQTSAESWGTGRAVSRIPRVAGGGTHRAGQGAFGNMCSGGGMFAPTKIWRKWHRKVNLTQRRHAVASAIAGSAFAGLVMGHGHRLDNIPEIPLVVTDDVQSTVKTKDATAFLALMGCTDELEKCKDSKKVRTGKGKSRNRRYVTRKGPLLVYSEDCGLVKAFQNIPGITLSQVDRLNLLDLAPGGVIGRLIIWTKSAFERLNELYGDYHAGSIFKSNYTLQRAVMSNPDLHRIINSSEIQSSIKPRIIGTNKAQKNKNALKNYSVRCRLDPAFKQRRRLLKRRIMKKH